MGSARSFLDVKRELMEYFSSMLRVPNQQIGSDVHILELGVDSIMLIEAQRWLKARFGCSIEVHQFFEELNTIDRIAAFVSTSQSPATLAADGHTDARQQAAPASSVQNDYGLLRSQLALVSEVIEAQNRLLTKKRRAGARSDDVTV